MGYPGPYRTGGFSIEKTYKGHSPEPPTPLISAGGVSDEWVTLGPMDLESELDRILRQVRRQVRIPSSNPKP
jgi:hypothetical protein